MDFQTFPKWQNLCSSKLKEFEGDNFDYNEHGGKVLQKGRKHCGKKEKLLITSNFSFSHSVLKRLVLKTGKNTGLFGKGLNLCAPNKPKDLPR